VKLGQHRSPETTLEVGVPQGSVLGPPLFAVYCSPVADVIASHDVRCHQYADDTQLHLAMRVDNTAAGLSIIAACTTDVKQWYMQKGLQLNPDKSEALFMGRTTQLKAVSFFICGCRLAGGRFDASSRRYSRSSLVLLL